MIGLLLFMLAQAPDKPVVLCTIVDGPVVLGQGPTTIGMKCCPKGSFISDPEHPTDAKGNLICYREET